MPKPSEYAPARRRIMQIVVWLILLGTVGLAAVVGESARRANRVELAPQSVTVGDVTAFLPNKWRARPRGDDDPRVIVQAADGAPGEEARTVRVLCDRLEAPMSPLQYLDAAFNVSLPGRAADGGEAEFSVTSTTRVAGQPGVLVILQGLPTRRQEVSKDLYACAVLPSMRAIVVHLHGSGATGHQDRAVVNGMAAKITVANEPGTVNAGETLTLPEGIELIVPKPLAGVAEKDPCRTERRLWPAPSLPTSSLKQTAQKFESNWTTVQLVGCFAPRGSGNDAKQREKMSAALGTMLLARDPTMWRGAIIAPEAPNVWRAEPPKPASGLASFPARAYLLTDGKGAGVLAEFRGGFEGGGFDAEWQALAESIKFPPPPDVNQLQQAGAAEAARLRSEGYEKVLADRQEQWWLWTGTGERPFLGWSHLDFSLSALSGKGETRLRRARGGVSGITEKFTCADADGGAYHADITRSDRLGEDVRSIQQTATLSKGELSVGIRQRTGAWTQWKAAPPPQFVPGALFPLVMGKLNLTAGPMLLRSESFLGCEALGPAEPLTILIRPGENATTRKAEGESQPMRCVTAQVNGSGQVTRWFFRRSGELEYVEFPNGVQRAAADENTIKSDFAQDSQMAP